MIYAREATRGECAAMRAELEKHGLTPNQITPRGRIVGVTQTNSLRVFAIVCRADTLEQHALETLARSVAAAQANTMGENETCGSF